MRPRINLRLYTCLSGVELHDKCREHFFAYDHKSHPELIGKTIFQFDVDAQRVMATGYDAFSIEYQHLNPINFKKVEEKKMSPKIMLRLYTCEAGTQLYKYYRRGFCAFDDINHEELDNETVFGFDVDAEMVSVKGEHKFYVSYVEGVQLKFVRFSGKEDGSNEEV